MIKKKKTFLIGISLIATFVVWTLLIRFVDVQAIGPKNSSVGFATLNGFIHKSIGVNMSLYTLTDWLGLVPIGVALSFAVLSLMQWIRRKHLAKVDYSLRMLGLFYITVIAVYILFEILVINYRPILIEGNLEASYPSSTTMLVICIMPTAMMQLYGRIKNKFFRQATMLILAVFTTFMIVGRLISGVHWITDIIGGSIISTGLVLVYYSIINCNKSYEK